MTEKLLTPEELELELNAMFFMKHRERLKIPWLYANKVDNLAKDCVEIFEAQLAKVFRNLRQGGIPNYNNTGKWLIDLDKAQSDNV